MHNRVPHGLALLVATLTLMSTTSLQVLTAPAHPNQPSHQNYPGPSSLSAERTASACVPMSISHIIESVYHNPDTSIPHILNLSRGCTKSIPGDRASSTDERRQFSAMCNDGMAKNIFSTALGLLCNLPSIRKGLGHQDENNAEANKGLAKQFDEAVRNKQRPRIWSISVDGKSAIQREHAEMAGRVQIAILIIRVQAEDTLRSSRISATKVPFTAGEIHGRMVTLLRSKHAWLIPSIFMLAADYVNPERGGNIPNWNGMRLVANDKPKNDILFGDVSKLADLDQYSAHLYKAVKEESAKMYRGRLNPPKASDTFVKISIMRRALSQVESFSRHGGAGKALELRLNRCGNALNELLVDYLVKFEEQGEKAISNVYLLEYGQMEIINWYYPTILSLLMDYSRLAKIPMSNNFRGVKGENLVYLKLDLNMPSQAKEGDVVSVRKGGREMEMAVMQTIMDAIAVAVDGRKEEENTCLDWTGYMGLAWKTGRPETTMCHAGKVRFAQCNGGKTKPIDKFECTPYLAASIFAKGDALEAAKKVTLPDPTYKPNQNDAFATGVNHNPSQKSFAPNSYVVGHVGGSDYERNTPPGAIRSGEKGGSSNDHGAGDFAVPKKQRSKHSDASGEFAPRDMLLQGDVAVVVRLELVYRSLRRGAGAKKLIQATCNQWDPQTAMVEKPRLCAIAWELTPPSKDMGKQVQERLRVVVEMLSKFYLLSLYGKTLIPSGWGKTGEFMEWWVKTVRRLAKAVVAMMEDVMRLEEKKGRRLTQTIREALAATVSAFKVTKAEDLMGWKGAETGKMQMFTSARARENQKKFLLRYFRMSISASLNKMWAVFRKGVSPEEGEKMVPKTVEWIKEEESQDGSLAEHFLLYQQFIKRVDQR